MCQIIKGAYMNLEELEFFSIKEFAKLLKIHPSTVRRAIKSGKLSSINVGSASRPLYRVPSSEINRIALFDLEQIIEKIMKKYPSCDEDV